ncbi:MAG: MaoC/PaaZ C-terminal domain-containing protein [Anaerolineaceae bacterium]|nr:MaoC/PaaZ C-terminal domain-containing protein [Anaerolineaceae bacterium]
MMATGNSEEKPGGNELPRGEYFEEVEVGRVRLSRARTITEADIIQFGSLTGDFNPLHFDAEFTRETMFGQRIAHGMLVASYAIGMLTQLGHLERTVLAFRALELKFSAPVFIGDTIRVEMRVLEKKPARRMSGGWVTSEIKIRKQDGTVVQSGVMTVLIASGEGT